MRVLITGGTGFVGGWTAKAIADAGHRVRFLVRNPAGLYSSVERLGVDVSDYVVGDITDADSVREALRGCDAVIHAAAVVATDPRQTAQMLATNSAGAHIVLGGAVELGLDPIIHVSSFTALFHPGLTMLRADLPVAGALTDMDSRKPVKTSMCADCRTQVPPSTSPIRAWCSGLRSETGWGGRRRCTRRAADACHPRARQCLDGDRRS